jgi:small subunit ribosomal protein S8
MVSDTVGDFIIQLKNAGAVGKAQVSLPYSKLKHAIATKLADAGYVEAVAADGEAVSKKLAVTLKYDAGGRHHINGVKRVSKPGRRLYAGVSEIHPVKFGKGNLILSTPAGILTDEEARAQHVGGEQLFIIW